MTDLMVLIIKIHIDVSTNLGFLRMSLNDFGWGGMTWKKSALQANLMSDTMRLFFVNF